MGVPIISQLIQSVTQLGEWIKPNAEKQDVRDSDATLALLKAYSAEFHQRQNRTWLDAFADGLNRLIRPSIVLAILSMFYLAYSNPSKFAEITLAISVIPDGYWTVLSIIIAFYFGGRMQLKHQQFKFSEKQANTLLALLQQQAAHSPISSNQITKQVND